MHKSQLGSARTVLIRDDIADLRTDPVARAKTVAQIQPGVVLTLLACQVDWCRAKVKGYRGWFRKDSHWGALPEDDFGDD